MGRFVMSHAEQLIRQKNQKFAEFVQNGQWHLLVTTCYAPHAKLAHFAIPDRVFCGREEIEQSFVQGSMASGYTLSLKFTIVKICDNAYLAAGVGCVNNGQWCPFVERWELIDGKWLIVEDKVYPPESWMG